MSKVSKSDKKVLLFIIIAFVLALGCACLFGMHRKYDTGFPIKSSLFADYGSFISGAFGTAAFILLILTYQKQSEELEYARKEAQLQSRNFHIQRFENTFFNLISLQIESTRNMDAKSRQFIYGSLHSHCMFPQMTQGGLNSLIAQFFKEDDLAENTFSRIDSIIEFIARDQWLLVEQKEFYAKILKQNLLFTDYTIIMYRIIGSQNRMRKRFYEDVRFFNDKSPITLFQDHHLSLYNEL